MPSAKIELGYGDKSFYGIFNFRNGKHGFWMCHETAPSVSAPI